MRIGSLFSGAGGLDLAVEAVFGADVAWHCEIDPAASKVLEKRWPGIPNLGDVSAINWHNWKPVLEVDILCGGFPCQDVSSAGKRAGIKAGTRSGLWSVFADAIDALRPQIVVIENVRGLLSARAHRDLEPADRAVGDGSDGPVLRAAGAVLGDLADLGYDAQWATVAASDVGTPHRRERVFILAADSAGNRYEGRPESTRFEGRSDAAVCGDEPGVALLPTPTAQCAKHGAESRFGGGNWDESNLWQIAHLLPTPRSSDCFGAGQHGDGGMDLRTTVTLLPSPSCGDADGGGKTYFLPTPTSGDAVGTGYAESWDELTKADGRHRLRDATAMHAKESSWGKYEAAIRRWEALTRRAPAPTEPNKNGNPRLSAAFSEWLMGWPQGWVTDPAIGISRNDQLRIIGNGVCPQQAIHALTWLIHIAKAAA